MITERHNLACRMIFKAISKTGSLGACVVSMDIGSNERLTMRKLQIPETAESRIVPKWLFPPHFSEKDRYNSSRPDFVLFLCSVQLVLRSGVFTILDLDEVDVTTRSAEVFGSLLSGVGGSAGGWRCCWGAPSLPQLPPATPKNPPPDISL